MSNLTTLCSACATFDDDVQVEFPTGPQRPRDRDGAGNWDLLAREACLWAEIRAGRRYDPRQVRRIHLAESEP